MAKITAGLRTRLLGPFLLGVILIPAPLAAQETTDTRLARIRMELPAPALARIEAALAQANQAGLPVEPLLDKALEGVAKGVPGDRIAAVVGTLTRELGHARSLLTSDQRPSPAPADVAAVADAMRRGVPAAAVRAVATTTPPDQPVALAVHTLGDLLDRGVPVDRALGVLAAWRARGGSAENLRDLPAAVDRLIREGVLPEQAAAAVAGAGGPPSGPPIPPGAGPPEDRGRGTGQEKGGPPGGGPPGGP